MNLEPQFLVTNSEQLRAMFPAPSDLAQRKVATALNANMQRLAQTARFLVLATIDPDGGLDCSPKGDPDNLLQVIDEHTVLIPDRPGNNRIDGLQNIVADPRVALILFYPGAHETFRINGRAQISTDPQLCARFQPNPKLVLVVQVEQAFLHCGRATAKAGLWKPQTWIEGDAVPDFAGIFSQQLGVQITKQWLENAD